MQQEYKSFFLDVVFLLALPGVLVALHLFLPDPIRNHLVFTYGESGVLAAWTSAFLHASDAHLYQNLTGYAIAVGFTYYLYTAYLHQRRRFWTTVAVLIAVTPFITAAVDYAVLYRYTGLLATGATSQGFSGIVSAFGGMLLAAIGFFVAEEYDAMTGVHTTLFIFLAALGILTAVNGILTPTITGLLIFGVGLLGTQYFSRSDLREPSRIRDKVQQHGMNIAQVASYGAVVCIFVYLILPIEVVQAGNFVNILAHTNGFVTGAITALMVRMKSV